MAGECFTALKMFLKYRKVKKNKRYLERLVSLTYTRKRKFFKVILDRWNKIQFDHMCSNKQKDCDEQIRTIQTTSNHEIESLKFKLAEANSIIDKDRREKLAIQDGLKKAYFKNIVSLNFEACNILGLEEEENEKNETQNVNVQSEVRTDNPFDVVHSDIDRKTMLLSQEVKQQVSPNKRFGDSQSFGHKLN